MSHYSVTLHSHVASYCSGTLLPHWCCTVWNNAAVCVDRYKWINNTYASVYPSVSSAYFLFVSSGALANWELSKALLISLDCQACSGIPLITPQLPSCLLEQSSALSLSSLDVLKWGQGGPINDTKNRQLADKRIHRKGFLKIKGTPKSIRIFSEVGSWKSWL